MGQARPPATDRPLVTLVHDGADEARWAAWLRELRAAWPGPSPAFRTFDAEQILLRACIALNELPERRAGPRPPHPSEVVILVRSPRVALGDVYKVADALHREHCPLLVLDDAPDAPPIAAGYAGVLVEPAGIAVRDAARIVHTLHLRQPVIRRLAQEVRAAQLAGSGISGEMERLGDELQLAARVQRHLVPQHLPEIDGLRLLSVYRPAGYVSGDIFEVRRLPDGAVAFFLADTVGHGVPAALLTVSIARAFAGAIGERHPAEALRLLNDELCRQLAGSGRFATAVCARYDPRTGEAIVSSAGHPPPILLVGGRRLRIEHGGPLLGVMPDADYEEAAIRLDDGDALVLFSDGLETAFPDPNAGDNALRLPTREHIERLAELAVRASGTSGPDEALRDFELSLERAAGSLHQPDDVTVLVIARPVAEAVEPTLRMVG